MRFFNRRRVNRALVKGMARHDSRLRGSIAVRTQGIRRAGRRNRVLLVTLLAVGGVVAVLTGISMGMGNWMPAIGIWDDGPGRPRARFGAAATFIEDQQQMLIFGGFVGSTSASDVQGSLGSLGTITGPPIVNDDATYLFKLNSDYFRGTWQRRDPILRPSARGFASMAYDGARKNVVLFGGAPYNSNNVSGETWIWNNQDWVLQNPPKPWPDPRQNAVMVYDAHRKLIVMFGGRGADGKPMNDTWIWNGSAWKIMPKAEGDPSPRHSAAIAYDFCRAEAVMFGGVGTPVGTPVATVSQPFETWTWDGAKWTPQSPKVSPPPRIGAGMAYSMDTGKVLLYGGLDTREAGVPTAATDDDMWRWLPAGYPGTGYQLAPTWERMNSDVTSTRDNATGPAFIEAGWVRHSPPPRGYASFIAQFQTTYFGSTFNLYGGTPSAPAAPTGLFDNLTAPLKGAQVAYGDHFYFGDKSSPEATARLESGSVIETPLTRRCVNPVPIPSDAGQIAAPEAPKLDTREGVREIDQLPVLVGTDWPENQRDTHLGSSQSPTTPNPKHTPPPDCPNRSQETGSNTHLFTDGQRNRVYQFFTCDPDRGKAYYRRPGQSGEFYQARPQVDKLLIEVYDGTTLTPLNRVIAKNVNLEGAPPSAFLRNLGHDPERSRFLLRTNFFDGSTWVTQLTAVSQDLIERGEDPVTGRFNLAAGDAGALMLDTLFTHPKTGRTKGFVLIKGTPSLAGLVGGTPPKLVQWDLEAAKEDWRIELTGCLEAGNQFFKPSAMRAGNRVYTVCGFGNNQLGVARVSITENADGTEIQTPGAVVEGFPGPTYLLDTWGDAQSERMILYSGNTSTVWVFDGKTSRWVGRVRVGGGFYRIWGFDKQTGRLYAHVPHDALERTQGGIFVLDIRLTPVPQAQIFPQFAFPPYGAVIASLPSHPGVPRKVFVRTSGGQMKNYPNWETLEFKNEMYYRVLADEVPIPDVIDLSDLDALTIPVAETPGKTEVSFDAEGSAYGIRLRSVGGVWSALRPPSTDSDGEVVRLGGYLIPACVFPDRELMAGWVPQARLSDLDALARSSGLEVDSNSKTDLQAPLSRCNPTANASNFPASIKVVFDVLWPLWGMVQVEGNKTASTGTVEIGKDADGNPTQTNTPIGTLGPITTPAGTLERGMDAQGNPTAKYSAPTTSKWDSHFKEVECVGDALKNYQAAVGNIYGSANCIQTQGKVKATANGSATGTGPTSSLTSSAGFSVAEGYSTVEVTREPTGRGVVVTSRAIARGIQIPGATVGDKTAATLSIDRVETVAVAWSNGRAPTDEEKEVFGDRATFTRRICGVHTPDGSIPGCLTSDQQRQFVENWNKGWGRSRSQIYLPKPDPDYFQGSPGGYIVGVLKPIADEVEDLLFAKDYQREVPGLVIEFYKDSITMGNARQTLQLAAVRAVAGLGVQCNPDYLYSPQKNDCIAIPDDLLDEEFFEEDEEEFLEEEELDGEWIPAEALEIPGESLGSKIGRLLDRLPVIRQLPIRQMGEALLAASVWVLLGLPLLFAWRRLSLNAP